MQDKHSGRMAANKQKMNNEFKKRKQVEVKDCTNGINILFTELNYVKIYVKYMLCIQISQTDHI